MVAATILVVLQHRASVRYNYLLATPWRWFAIQALWLPVYWIGFVPLAFGIRHAAGLAAAVRHRAGGRSGAGPGIDCGYIARRRDAPAAQ